MNSSRTTNYQLLNLCKHFGIPIRDICNKDLLNQNQPCEGGYIINMQDSTDGHGTHWVALWLEKVIFPGKTSENITIYFDSFGIDPPLAVIEFCERYGGAKARIVSSTKVIQNINGGHCGQYCIDFLKNMMNKHIRNPIERFNKFIDYYY